MDKARPDTEQGFYNFAQKHFLAHSISVDGFTIELARRSVVSFDQRRTGRNLPKVQYRIGSKECSFARPASHRTNLVRFARPAPSEMIQRSVVSLDERRTIRFFQKGVTYFDRLEIDLG